MCIRDRVRRELDAAKFAFNELAERFDRARLGHAGQSFHEDVAIGEERDQQAFDHGFLADDRRIHRGGDLFEGFVGVHIGKFTGIEPEQTEATKGCRLPPFAPVQSGSLSWLWAAPAWNRCGPEMSLSGACRAALLVALWAGEFVHHFAEAEAAGLHARREFFEAMEPLPDISGTRPEHEHMIDPPMVCLLYTSRCV